MIVKLPYPVSVNRMWRNFKGRMVLSAEGRAWKQHAALLAKMAGFQVLHGPIDVRIEYHPKLTKKGVASNTRMDLGNVEKVFGDAMRGVAYEDDKQVERLLMVIGPPVDGGGLTVTIEQLAKPVSTCNSLHPS